MNPLKPLPSSPSGVQYALTVPQSVLFADISLRGSRRSVLSDVFGGDFQFHYVVIDDGAMSWDYTGDEQFACSFLQTADPAIALRRFISTMASTARAVERTSWLVAPPATRRKRDVTDVVEDLEEYWNSYERHMTSLFTFWNVEAFMSTALVESLRRVGSEAEIQTGLQRFLQPNETNYFTLERRQLRRLAARFRRDDNCDPSALGRALDQHVQDFAFLLSPFNLGTPPSVESLLERLNDVAMTLDKEETPLLDSGRDLLTDLPEPTRELGLLAQELAFWKTERLDVMALGDARVADLYREAADLLAIETDDLFAMSRDEILASLRTGSPVVAGPQRLKRRDGFCLLLQDEAINFYQPSTFKATNVAQHDNTDSIDEIRGSPASQGVVSGRVRVITSLSEINMLEAGEILVTTMTRPEMGVALDRASAFVTDEGGQMCHAAIIAREMKKPCVIGTGLATSVLRTGMIVTVKGEDGTVQIDRG